MTKCDSSAMIAITVRACTGFDRPAEDGEAYPWTVTTLKHGLKLNAEDNLAYAA